MVVAQDGGASAGVGLESIGNDGVNDRTVWNCAYGVVAGGGLEGGGIVLGGFGKMTAGVCE